MKQKPGLPTPVTSSPVFRRRRTIWCLLICITCFFVFFLTSSTSLYPSGLFGSSPAEPNSLGRDILELHGLQHFVLNSDLNLHNVLYKANRDRPQGIPVRDHIRDDSDDSSEGAPDTERDRLDPTKEIDLKVYSSFDGDDDWVKHVKKLQTNSPLVVFSKVRWKSVLPLHLSHKCMWPGGVRTPCCDPYIRGGGPVALLPHILSFYSHPQRNAKLMVIGHIMHIITLNLCGGTQSRIAHFQSAPKTSYRLMA